MEVGFRMSIKKVFEKLGDFSLTSILFIFVFAMVLWPLCLWGRKALIGFGCPPAFSWMGAGLYFSFWIWLYLLVPSKGNQNYIVILVAICCGSLFAVAAGLCNPGVQKSMAEIGFHGASWVVILCGGQLVMVGESLVKRIPNKQRASQESKAPDGADS
jgi:hypothetical protein